MDSLTHALTGALIADALPVTRRLGPNAPLLAAIAGMAPDADMIIPFIGNIPHTSLSFHGLFNMDLVMAYHRAYTHSFFYTFLASIVLAFPLRKWVGKGRGAWWHWALLTCLAVYSHIVLDITNPWNVRCWLPFSPRGEAWTLMPLMDPFFTGLLGLVFVVNHVFRDRYGAGAESGIALPEWKRKTSAALDRFIGIAPLAWATAVVLTVRVLLTVFDVIPRPVLLS